MPMQRGERAATASAAPLTPAGYIRLRREAAGLSVRTVAGMLTRNATDAVVAFDLINALETLGNTARRPETLEALRSIFPLDPDVYRQLTSDPADSHPRICRGCGCSHWDPCTSDEHAACAWVTDTACTACLPDTAPVECCQ
ncbi:hypothetical protein [Sphingomonas faeni]|uniref:hypothetical protein n=1 Tax=Sphingomonas faeni TaxID=185950 RepID=UPI0020C7B426|nr:hypothetical protein [Sphingomonas faeni]MCP8891284.1 hypothetical protein [Sphingomonas faeni]